MITYWPSPAKLNLFLYINEKRSDGYHSIQTLFQLIDFGDLIKIKLHQNDHINVLTSISNSYSIKKSITKAILFFKKEAKKKNHLPKNNGIDIYIKKNIPIGSGLGGSSTNIATILVALNYLWKCGFTENELAKFGLTLGADVPFFIRGYSALAEGIGELILPIQLKEKWYLVVNPGICICTSSIFNDPELPCHKITKPIKALLEYKFSNDCEIIVRKRFIEVDRAFSWLLKYVPVRLTGTGSCIFAEFENKLSAIKLLNKLPEWLYGFVTHGINISPLRQIIIKQDQLY